MIMGKEFPFVGKRLHSFVNQRAIKGGEDFIEEI